MVRYRWVPGPRLPSSRLTRRAWRPPLQLAPGFKGVGSKNGAWRPFDQRRKYSAGGSRGQRASASFRRVPGLELPLLPRGRPRATAAPLPFRELDIIVPPLAQLVKRFRPRRTASADELLAGPIRGEPLGADHLGERALALARGQRLSPPSPSGGSTPLLTRLNGTRTVLDDARERLVAYAAEDGDVAPAGEWLLDNYHVVDEHIREVHESLPRGYYR